MRDSFCFLRLGTLFNVDDYRSLNNWVQLRYGILWDIQCYMDVRGFSDFCLDRKSKVCERHGNLPKYIEKEDRSYYPSLIVEGKMKAFSCRGATGISCDLNKIYCVH